MLGFIYRLTRQFELEHGIRPNLLYLNHFHAEHLKSAFDEDYSMAQIRDVLGMEVIIENDIVHPRMAWAQAAEKAVAF
jgi:hypothetical protein